MSDNPRTVILKVGTTEYQLNLTCEQIKDLVCKYGKRRHELLEAEMENGWNKNAIRKNR